MLVLISQKKIDSNHIMDTAILEYCKLYGIKDKKPTIKRECQKPIVEGLDLFISLSHSGDKVVCAVDNDRVGIDIEKIKERDYKKIARRFFESDKENISLKEFYLLWTAKEAYKKGRDIPLVDALKNTDYKDIRVLNLFNDYALAVYGKGTIFIMNI